MRKHESARVDIADRKPASLEKGILNTLFYFDIFNYPLTKNEIHKFCHCRIISDDEFNEELNLLLHRGNIKYADGYYFLNEPSVIERRKKGNILADKYSAVAEKYSLIISKFPFVKAVFISGSLSKGYMDTASDIDYFIITKPGRLWLCRSFLVLYKKLFLFNSHKYFCVNYFIDANNLEIPDKNIFTATELVTLIPMINFSLFKKFQEANPWTKNFLPNIVHSNEKNPGEEKNVRFKSILEKLFNGRLGNMLDNLCLQMTMKFWKKKFTHFSEDDFKNALRSKKDVSKHHPNKFQEKVLALYDEKIKQSEKSQIVSFALLNKESSASLFQ